ncbi:MAG: universal stress protein [Armatimonadota bacterium]|nr:universal stress protein [Armatimonadota bacterium]MDR5703619.1 universal stress protein [Armatimonadota bacterium]
MSLPLDPNPIGMGLAGLFAFALLSILWWMLHVPPPVPRDVARAVHSVNALKRILVPIFDTFYSERAVELACRLVEGQQATIILGYVIEVPRTLPLDIPLPRSDERAKEITEQATQIVARHHLPVVRQFIRAREAGEGIIRAARENRVDLIVLGLPLEFGLVESMETRAMGLLLRKAPCEVIVDRVPAYGKEELL